jgi:putative protease
MDQQSRPLEKPELLAPAGNLEKLYIAFANGADAVYLGGKVFGLRKYADNFTDGELRHAVEFANSLNKQVYVVLNGFAHDDDLAELGPHLDTLQSIQPHGFIISDWAVAALAKQRTTVPVHASTQASITNWRTVQAWKDLGASRVILAREVSVDECKVIMAHCPIEIEIFVHGAMCASYSGKCVISNYSAGRDSNRGGCIQSCRHPYTIDDVNTHVMNAKDLMGIGYIESSIRAGIASLKIEGRMKSNLYVANASSVYRAAIDYCFDCMTTDQIPDTAYLMELEDQLKKVSNRTFSSGGLGHRPDASSIHYEFGGYEKQIEIAATVRAVRWPMVLIEPKTHIYPGDCVECLNAGPIEVKVIEDLVHQPLEVARAGGLAWIVPSRPLVVHDILIS